MNTYECFWNRKRTTVTAETLLDAQKKGAYLLGCRKSYQVAVVLVAMPSGPVSVAPASLGA